MPRRLAWESGRHPFEILLHLWAVLNGVIFLTGAVDRPRSIAETLPHWVQIAWFGLLAIGGSVGLLAGWMQGRIGHVEQGLRVEGGALSFLMGGVVLYSSAIVATAGWAGVAASSLTGMYAVACLVRLLHIARDLRQGHD